METRRTIPRIDPKVVNGILDEEEGERADPLDACSRAAAYLGVRFFAVQNGGWCGGIDDEGVFWGMESIDGCENGLGGYFRNDVYEFE